MPHTLRGLIEQLLHSKLVRLSCKEYANHTSAAKFRASNSRDPCHIPVASACQAFLDLSHDQVISVVFAGAFSISQSSLRLFIWESQKASDAPPGLLCLKFMSRVRACREESRDRDQQSGEPCEHTPRDAASLPRCCWLVTISAGCCAASSAPKVYIRGSRSGPCSAMAPKKPTYSRRSVEHCRMGCVVDRRGYPSTPFAWQQSPSRSHTCKLHEPGRPAGLRSLQPLHQ